MPMEKNIRLAADVFEQVKQRAQAEGLSVDEAATEAVRIGLQEDRWRRLIAAGRRYGGESGYTEADIESVIAVFRDENRGR